MPILFKIRYENGSQEMREFSPEIWRDDSQWIAGLLILDRAVSRFELDSLVQSADADRQNNDEPRRIEREDFDLKKPGVVVDLMQKVRESRRSQGEESEP